MIPDNILISAAQFNDQGKVADFLISTFMELLEKRNSKAKENGIPELNIKDELLAADDFYFSSIELMDCCLLAKDEDKIIGLCCVNPYTSSLQYLSVNTDYQRQGIGSKLLSIGKKVLSKRGCSHIKTDIPAELATESSLKFYEKNKMREVSRNVLISGKIF